MAAYNFNELVEKLKARGLDLAEDGAKGVVGDVFDWLEGSVKNSPTPYDDIMLGILPVIKAQVLKSVDAIDGQIG